MLLGKLDIYMKKSINKYMSFTLCQYQVNTHYETLKFMQERKRNIFDLISIGNDFLNRTQITQQIRESTDRWDYMKLKTSA
jgi:hypothetical protein